MVQTVCPGFSAKDEKTKTPFMLHVIGEEALEIYNTITRGIENDNSRVIANHDMSLAQAMAKFESFC